MIKVCQQCEGSISEVSIFKGISLSSKCDDICLGLKRVFNVMFNLF